MPSSIITATASTFGTITGVLAGDAGEVSGSVTGIVVGTLDGSVGVPGPAGVGVPAGGSTGMVLKKVSGTDYDTAWQTDLNSGVWGQISGTLTNQLDLVAALALKADLASPALSGVPTAPTAPTLTSTTQLATTAFVQQELAAGTAVAKNLEVYVRNQTGATLTAGTIVYINGSTGNRPTVTKAQANNDANSAQTFGFTKTSIANNGFGYVIVRGELENVDTSALTEGQQLYLSPTTAGTWTTTKPSAPQHMVYVGIVVRAHPTQGVILVAIQNGLELEELHNVSITTPTDGQVLKYEAATGLWKNGTDVGGVAWGGITGTLTAQVDLSNALDSKADLSGDTFTGKVNLTPSAADAGLNIGTLASAPTNLVNGDLWIGDNLNYRNQVGGTRTVLNAQTPNTVTVNGVNAPLTLNQAGSGAALAINNTGTGSSLIIDNGTPDVSFTVDADGRVGIGTAPDATAALKVDAGGIKFNDNTTQTTAYPGSTGFLLKADNLAGLANTGTARSNLGLGGLATINDAPSDGVVYGRQNGAWVNAEAVQVDVQTFGGPSSSGSFTWTKPAGAKWVEVFMIAAGGGGGSGARYPTTTARYGGGGGGGGSVLFTRIHADNLASTETVIVGAGGAGGAATTTNGQPGSTGGAGSDCSFGPYFASGGSAGNRGTTSAAASVGARYALVYVFTGAVGNGGAGSGATPPALTFAYFAAPTGGGGGASALASSTTDANGGAGGGKSSAGPLLLGLISSVSGGAGGIASSSTAPTVGVPTSGLTGGTGGGGGYYKTAVVGTAGANGAFPGGGGGGGSASDNGYDSGAGGNGGNGYVVITTYCV